jgi:hypothetical protein
LEVHPKGGRRQSGSDRLRSEHELFAFVQGMMVGKSAKKAGGMQAKATFLVVGKRLLPKRKSLH